MNSRFTYQAKPDGNIGAVRKNTKRALKWLGVVILLIVALNWLIPALTPPEAQTFVKNLGPLGPLVIIFYTIISHVLAPLAGTPGILLSVTLFGVIPTFIYLYIASMISAAISFYIAQKYGRGWVERLVGQDTMREIDDFVSIFGTEVLIVSRACRHPQSTSSD